MPAVLLLLGFFFLGFITFFRKVIKNIINIQL
jgi:hypothetical protein